METLAERLRRLRTDQGHTIASLASAARTTEGTIRNIESGGTHSPGVHLMIRLADALHVDVRYLTFGEGLALRDRLDAIERRLDKLERRDAHAARR